MEFKSKEEMLDYEKAREDYYLESIRAVNEGHIGRFYYLWLREIFIPKYRKLKKEYDNYSGGWYKDENGFIHTKHISFVDLDTLEKGSICIEEDVENFKSIYVLGKEDDKIWYQFTKQSLEYLEKMKEQFNIIEDK